MGNEKFKNGDYEAAVCYYSKILQYDQANYLVQANRALCYIKCGLYGYAYEDIIEVLRQKPDFVKGHYRLGLVYQQMEMYYEAYRSFKRACELDDSNSPEIINALKLSQAQIEEKHVFKGRPSVLMIGNNEEGCCGIGEKAKKKLHRLTPVEDLQGVDVSELACGLSNCACITESSELYVWGANSYKQCGMDGRGASCLPIPTFLRHLTQRKVKAVACGAAHTLVTTNMSIVYSWGMNTMGQCGLDTEDKIISEPTQLQTLISDEIKGIACGMAHSFFLTNEGNLYCCGWNQNGQLGYGEADKSLRKPYRLYLKEDEKFQYISCGGCHTIMITKETGKAYTTGLNSCGQLGLGSQSDQFKPQLVDSLASDVHLTYASCGEEFSFFVSESGKVYSCGLNNVGQCGFDPEQEQMIEIPSLITSIEDQQIEYIVCGKGEAMAINNRGSVYKWGSASTDESFSETRPKVLTTYKNKEVLQISSGREFFGILLAATDIKKSFATGKALNSSIKAGKKTYFEIITVDKTGFMRSKGGDRVNVFGINQVSGKIIDPKTIDIFDPNTGRYEVTLKIRDSGKYLLHVLVNGEPVQMSPFILDVKPGELEASKCSLTFTPCNNFKFEDEPVYKMTAGETVFFTIIFRDRSGAEIDEIEDFSYSRLKIKQNGNTTTDKEIKWDIDFSEFGDNTLKMTCFLADFHKVQVYLDDYLLPLEIDMKIIARIKEKKIENIQTDFINLDITESYAFPQKCCIEDETYTRFPLAEGERVQDKAIRAGHTQHFMVLFKDEFGNPTSLVNEVLNIQITEKDNQMEIKDLQIHEENEYKRKVTFCIKQSGSYQVTVQLGDEPIRPQDKAFDIHVIHSEADFAWTKVLNHQECFSDEDLMPKATIEREIIIQARDQYGNYCHYLDWEKDIECRIFLLNSRTKQTEELKTECTIDLPHKDSSISKFPFTITKPGTYKIQISTSTMGIFGSPFYCTLGDVEARLQAEHEQREALEQARRAQEQERQLQLEKEEKARLKLELERKQKEIQQKIKQQEKEEQAKDLERRRRIAERMKRIRELEREKEATRKLNLQKLQQKMERKKKMKRIGGGFTVPYELTADEADEMKKTTKMQNWMQDVESEEEKQ
ncbi:unnamed protein product [Moneuplotes crassus]|uniref:RCC1-like domain-containing protein n=1 Tax=Euplotes crassus TaxID=5936 RepID=A0AAD1XJW5_EUPCR|nr:unnamed protein product [Moneuplotes crassus]